jgi:hypothetical protein
VVDDDSDGVENASDLCPGTVIPELVPTESLKHKRYALVDADDIFDTVSKSKKSNKSDKSKKSEKSEKSKKGETIYTTLDTGGCSCEQIIDRTGAGYGHRKFGCSNSLIQEWIAGRP